MSEQALTTAHTNEGWRDSQGRRFQRVELNGHWVKYRYLTALGRVSSSITFPRVPIISDEALMDLRVEDEIDS